MRKIILFLLVVIVNVSYSQINYPSNNLAIAKTQQASIERINGSLNSVNSLPEQDLAGAIPVCQTSYSVLNSYVGSGLISEIASNTCLGANEKNSAWYSFTCYGVGRLKYMITPNNLPDDYDYALYDLTGHSYSDIQNGIITPIICNFSASGGKTGLDSSGVNANEPASGPNFNPLINLIQGHNYVLNISNFSSSTFGYFLSFSGTTANIGNSISTIQNVVSYCGADSITVNLSSHVSNSSIASNGSDFILTSSTGTYNVVSAYGVSGTGNSSSIVLKLGSLISTSGTFSLGVVTGTDGNTLLNTCSSTAIGVVTYTFNNTILYSPPTSICQNQTFTLSASAATSYTWTGTLVPPPEINNQSLSITTNTYGNFTFTLAATGSCGMSIQTFSVDVNPTPNTVITSTFTSVCAGSSALLHGTGAANYFWSVVNPSYEAFLPVNYNTLNYNASPLQTNVYQLTGTNTFGCSSAAFYTLTALPKPIVTISGSDTVCFGIPAVLSYSGTANTYTWTTGAINIPTISVSPGVTSNFSVTGTGTNGCKTVAGKSIVVIGQATVAATKPAICLGDSSVLSITGPTSYTWSNGVTSTPITVKPNITTTYSVAYDGIASCGVLQTTFAVTVNAIPSLTITPSTNTICSGVQMNFNSSSSVGITSYTWSTGGTAVLTWITPPISPTTYTSAISLSVTSTSGCKSSTGITYNIFALPQISTTLSSGLCVGDTSLLVASGGVTYTWSPGSILSNSMVISPTVTTNYTVAAINAPGCRNTQTLTVAKSASSLTAVANPSIVCEGYHTNLTATGNGILKWYTSDTAAQHVATGLNYMIYNLSAGSYTYYVSSTCTGSTYRKPVIFNVYSKPIINVATPTNTVCLNGSFQIIATGATSYTWTSGPAYPSINVVNDTLTQVKTSPYALNYYVNGTDLHGCVGTNTMTMNVFPTLQTTVTATPNTVCMGSPSVLSLTGVPSYTWSTGVVSTTAVVTPTVLTTYTVNFPTPYGCVQPNYVNVNVYNAGTYISSSVSSTICSGNTLTLTGMGASTYSWSNGVVGPNIVVTPTTNAFPGTVTYSVSSTNGVGCAGSSAVTLTVYPSPNVNIVATKDTVCMGSAATMTATGATSYTWSNNSTNTTYYPGGITVPTTYSVIGKNSYGCKASYIKNIGIYSIIQATAVVSPTTQVCSGQPVFLSAAGVPSYSVAAYGGPYNVPKAVYPSPSSTIYYINANDVHGCASTCSISVTSDGSALFNVSGPYNVCSGTQFNLGVSNSTLTYVWNPPIALSVSGFTTTASTSTVGITYTVTGNNMTCSSTQTISPPVIQSPSVSVVVNNTITCSTPTVLIVAVASGSVSYQWSRYYNNIFYIQSSSISNTLNVTVPGIYYCVVTAGNGCTATATCVVSSDFSSQITLTPSFSVCEESPVTLFASGGTTYSWGTGGIWGGSGPLGSNASSITLTPTATAIYSVSSAGSNGCVGTATTQLNVVPGPTILFAPTSVICEGSSISIIATGADTYSWSTGANTASINVIPAVAEIFTVTGTDMISTCSSTQTISLTVDNTCSDVWPGDANSDGVADNLDVLELGLHYTQTGTPRASSSNNWQSYFANNWIGTITNGKNLNNSDCNGDGIINDDDTLAIFNNYGLTHAFKPVQTNTINPQITIVPDQFAVVKGTWGTASIYLGDATTNINNINGVAFTVDFDNTLIEPSNVWIEYQNSFIDASQNLYFRKLDFANSKLFTASTHTVSNNVSGFGKIATLHYQILSSLVTDEVLNIGVSQANQSDATGLITPLTSGSGALMAIGASVGVKENLLSGNVLISPNPTNGVLNISFNAIHQNTKIELYNSIGALVLTEVVSNKNNTINISDLSSGIYFMKVLEVNRVMVVKKVVKE